MQTTIDEDGYVEVVSEISETFLRSELVIVGMMLGKLGARWIGTTVSGEPGGVQTIRVLGRME